MRIALREFLTTIPELMDIVPANKWIQRSSLSEKRPPLVPFAVIAVSDVPAREVLGTSRLTGVDIWLHDKPGSYLRIDRALQVLETKLPERVQFEHGGYRLTCVEPKEISGDLYDDLLRTITRTMRLRVIASRIG